MTKKCYRCNIFYDGSSHDDDPQACVYHSGHWIDVRFNILLSSLKKEDFFDL